VKIGEVASRVGTTARTIRYYEEIGLLPGSDERPSGGHRVYDERDIERLQDALRLKELLGLSLDELKTALEAEEALALIERQLALVRRRREEIDALEGNLLARRKLVRSRLKQV
jgi:DNA-binding transcriptional MerR regulator